ncbi:MAG: hypothetical protein KatS3mg087_1302 [Patescibacteria group bacterium]|nr:MAG: hypothetical protein KatS3mg087_1302 [Patescibacteria group bacterium]
MSVVAQIIDTTISKLQTHSASPDVYEGLNFKTQSKPVTAIVYLYKEINGRRSASNILNTIYEVRIKWRIVKTDKVQRGTLHRTLMEHLREVRRIFHYLNAGDISSSIPGFFMCTTEYGETFDEEIHPEYEMINEAIGEVKVLWEFFEAI